MCNTEITQFYLPTTHERYTCLYSPAARHRRPLAGTHYAYRVPTKRWPGCVDLGGWLHTEIKVPHQESHPDTVTHPSTSRARRRLTSLIETKELPLRQTTAM